jgi:hypothetical protein
MKTLNLSFLVAVFVLVSSERNDRTDLVVFGAIKGVLEDHFAPHEPKVDLYFSGPDSEDLANKLLREKPAEVSVQVIRLDGFKQVQLNSPSILLFDSGEHHLKVYYNITWTSKSGLWHNHLVYAPKTGALDVLAEFSRLNMSYENQNFIEIVNDTTVDLVTAFSFSPEKCNSPHYKTINRFSTNTMKWQNQTFFPEKYQNLHNCVLQIGYVERDSRISSRNIFAALAQQLNSRLWWVNTTSCRNSTLDLIECFAFHNFEFYKDFEVSSSLYCDHVTFTVPAGEPYTQLEKMFLMFDKWTWICIGVTLSMALLTIQLINFMSVKVQKFIFGRDVQTPTLNVADIFLNGSQVRVPGRNFARFMLTMFIIWSLIIRTCYQSELYKNLQQDMRKPRIKSIKELNERNFTLLYLRDEEIEISKISVNRQFQVSIHHHINY